MAATPPYAQFLDGRDPFEVLVETQQSIPAIARTLGTKGMKRPYAPGKWTAAEVLAHLVDCEIAYGFRVRQIIAEPELAVQTFNQDLWARHYGTMDGREAANTFAAVRAWNLALFRLLSRDDLDKAAVHPERGPEKADTVIRIMAGHTLHHLAQLEQISAASS